jgi:hypothetical protein
MLRDPGKADFSGTNNYGQSFSHAIARTADVRTLRILSDARPASLSVDIALQDASGKTSVEYLEDKLMYLEASEVAELREAFAELVSRLEEGSRVVEAHHKIDTLHGEDSTLSKELGITLRITELDEDALDASGEFYDAIESF